LLCWGFPVYWWHDQDGPVGVVQCGHGHGAEENLLHRRAPTRTDDQYRCTAAPGASGQRTGHRAAGRAMATGHAQPGHCCRPGVGWTGRVGIRLDSGDLGALAVASRRILDAAGLPQARIVASGGLDEYSVAELVVRGAPIDAYGVGTKMGVCADAPSLDSAYKLVAFGDRPVMKLSEGKATLPAAKQVYRGDRADGDLLALRDEPPPPDREPLLVPVIRNGHRLTTTNEASDVVDARRRCDKDLAWLPVAACGIADPAPVPVHRSARLITLRNRLAAELRSVHSV